MTASGLASSFPLMVNSAREVQSGLGAAFDRCSRGLYRYFAVRAGGDAHLADDLMQQL